MSMRQVRLEAAHRELGSRHPWVTILGRPVSRVLGLAAVAALVLLGLRWAWNRVSAWWAADPAPAVSSVSGPVSVSAVPWWGWSLGLVLLGIAIYFIRVRLRFGFWTL